MASGAPAAPAEALRDDARAKKEYEEVAGTGMGEREHHPTVQVAFDYDRGMYKPSQALVIYYGFDTRPVPNPFPNLGYADEM
jgi:hypothetical protein